MTTEKPTLTTPLIHLNGTSAKALAEQIESAANAVQEAIVKLSDAAPHGRDYYPKGERAIWDAQAEHGARAEKLREVFYELSEIYRAILDQLPDQRGDL